MRRFAWTVGLVLVLIGSAMPAAAMEYSLLTEHKISPESLSQMLEAGSMLLVDYDENGNMRLITSAIAIDAPPEQVLAAINDFEHFPEFMPSTRSVEVVGREGDQTLVSFEIVFKFSVFTQKVRYVHRQHEVPGKGYWWELESGDLGASVGSWEVVPLDGGKRSAAVYSIYTDIRPVGAIIKYFIETQPGMDVALNASTCVLVLKAIRDRVETGAYAGVSAPPEPAAESESGGTPETGATKLEFE